MKKCKLVMTLLSILLIACMLTGCTMPELPFGKKDDAEQGDSTDDFPDAKITGMEGLTFNVGDQITFDDLASMSMEDDGNAISKMILQADGTVIDSYTLEETGMFSIMVVAQFLDGTSETAEIIIEVIEPETSLPEKLANSVASKEWQTTSVMAYGDVEGNWSNLFNGAGIVVSNTLDVTDSLTYEPVTISVGNGYQIQVTYMPAEYYNIILSTNRNIFKVDSSFMPIYESLLSWVGGFDETGESSDMLSNIVSWYGQFYVETTAAAASPTDYYLYDSDGNSYQIMVVTYTADTTQFGGEVFNYAGPAYVDYNGGKLLLTVVGGDATVTDISVPGDGGESEEDSEEQPDEEEAVVATYDEFKAAMSTLSASELRSLYSTLSVDDVTREVSRIVDDFIIGDVSGLLPDAPPDSAIVTDPVEEDPGEIVGAVADSYVPYSTRYPKLYEWPEKEERYTRWVYVIDEETNFTSSIIYPDKVIISGDVEDQDWRIDMTGTESGQLPSRPSSGVAEGQGATLTSLYTTYTVDISELPSSTIDQSESTSGRTVIKQGTNTYYIETSRASAVQNYITNCLYDSTGFTDGDFRVTENGDRTTAIGRITNYKIDYTANNKTYSSSYMAVYNINNDYLVCYGDELTNGADDTFVDLLEQLVKIQ